MKVYKEIVLSKLSRRELYEQLAEECSELAQASLKCIRAEGLSNNATPTSATQALSNLLAEVGDVMIVLECLGIEANTKMFNNSPKWRRWAERLSEGKDNESMETD